MADEQGKIEVQLSILSGQESAAFREIQQTAKQVTEMMQMFKSRDFIETAERLAKVHEQMTKSSAQMNKVSKDLQQQERQSGVRGVLSGTGPLLDSHGQPFTKDGEKKAHEDLAQRQKDEQEKREESRRQKRLESMTDEERAASHRREKLGIPELRPGQTGNQWYDRVSTLTPDAAGIRIPQFGEMTVQDILGIGRDHALRRANQSTPGTADWNRHGNRAAMWDAASRRAGDVAAVRASFRQIQRHVTRPAQGFVGQFDETMPMGYRRDTNPFSDALGFQLPFSAYGQQGAREKWDQWSMRWSAGINAEQAAEINNAANQAGFAGRMGTSVRRDFMAPAFREYKIDPQNLIPFTQTLRTGTSSIQELNAVVMQLGEGARSARMDVNSYTQAVSQSGEAAQASGGRFIQGVQFGNQFGSSTGLAPTVGNQLMQNPVVQGYVAARTGLPPNLAGAASPLAQQRSIEQALMERVSAFEGTMPSHREPIRDTSGAIIGYEETSGRDAAIGAAAQSLGINQEEAKAILNRKGSTAVQNFQAAARDYQNRAMGGKTPNDQKRQRGSMIDRWNKEGKHRFRADENFRYDEQTGKVLRKRGGIHVGDQEWSEDEEKTQALRDSMYGDAAKRQERNASGADLRELHRMAMAAGVSQGDWESQVDGQKDIAKRVQAAQKLVQNEVSEVNDGTQTIKFTGPAAKFFEALVKSNSNLAGSADLSKASVATSNTGSRPLTNTTNSGGPLFP